MVAVIRVTFVQSFLDVFLRGYSPSPKTTTKYDANFGRIMVSATETKFDAPTMMKILL